MSTHYPDPDPEGELDNRDDGIQTDELWDGETSNTEDPERELTPGEIRAFHSGMLAALKVRAASSQSSPLDQVFESRSRGNPRRGTAPSLRDVEQMTQPPLDFNPAMVEKQKGFEYETDGRAMVGEAAHAMTVMRDCLVNIIARRERSKRDPLLIGQEAVAVMRVADYADTAASTAAKVCDSANKVLDARVTRMRDEMRKEMIGDHTANGPVAQEIRLHCKSLAPDARAKFVGDLIEHQDRRGLAAVLLERGYLTGLDQRMVDLYVTAYNRRHHGETLRRIDYIQKAQQRLERAGASLVLKAEGAMGASWRTVKRLRDARASSAF